VKILRSLAGVCVGFGVFYAIVRWTSGSDLPARVSWTVTAGILGGYLAALISGAHEFPHAAAVGMLMIVAGFVSMLQQGVTQPGWNQISIAGCGPISALIGAAIRLLTKSRPTSS